MTLMLIAGLALVLFQLWLLPAALGAKNTAYLVSSRDNPPPQTQVQERTTRAGSNLQESLPAYLALCLLAIIQQVDLSQIAAAWLVLRVLYIPCYLFGVLYLRSIIWFGSLGALVYMAMELV